MNTERFEWVDNDRRLAELSQQWQQQAAIAIDTEFVRSRTFFPAIGLVQIADTQGIYLIDPLAISDTTPLQAVLKDPQVVKVIHACSEDIEVFLRYLSVLPTPLFDTQIAASFAGYGASIGYANLLKAIEGLSIPKQETRSDWLQRPLSQAQLNYAALDVQYLLSVYHRLCADLEKSQRTAWVQDECEQLLAKYAHPESDDHYYRRIKSAWKLKPQQLAVLQRLCAWREQRVRKLDIPRSRLIKDGCLFDIALRLPQSSAALQRIRDISPRFINGYTEECLQMVEQALAASSDYPEDLAPPLTPAETDDFKRLKAKVRTIADSLDIPPEFLVRKKTLEALVRSAKAEGTPAVPAQLQGWRYPIVTEVLLESLNS